MNIKFLQNNENDDWDVGDTITIETTVEQTAAFEDNYTKFDPDTIEITIIGYNDNEVVSAASMTKDVTGRYYYNWDTSGLSAGDYEIEIEASANGATEKDDEWIRITD